MDSKNSTNSDLQSNKRSNAILMFKDFSKSSQKEKEIGLRSNT